MLFVELDSSQHLVFLKKVDGLNFPFCSFSELFPFIPDFSYVLALIVNPVLRHTWTLAKLLLVLLDVFPFQWVNLHSLLYTIIFIFTYYVFLHWSLISVFYDFSFFLLTDNIVDGLDVSTSSFTQLVGYRKGSIIAFHMLPLKLWAND